MHKPVLILFVLLITSVCHLPLSHGWGNGDVIHSSIPKKFGFLWNQFLKSTVFYGINSKKVLFLAGFSNESMYFCIILTME
jgi:hypothetical protein